MQKHKDNDNINAKCKYCKQAPKFQLEEVSMNVGIAIRPQNSVSKGKYECGYCNQAAKFQLVKVSTNVIIANLNEKSTLNVITTCKVTSNNPSRCFGYP